mgnify:CR=1 FL=1
MAAPAAAPPARSGVPSATTAVFGAALDGTGTGALGVGIVDAAGGSTVAGLAFRDAPAAAASAGAGASLGLPRREPLFFRRLRRPIGTIGAAYGVEGEHPMLHYRTQHSVVVCQLGTNGETHGCTTSRRAHPCRSEPSPRML